MPEHRHVRSGSLNIPNGTHNPDMPAPRFDGPRSPPNTSHVPCKFFRQGACQAGNACPFSHDLSAATETVCKYFAKGNCKFGPKCANIHVLPDGRRINYGKNGVTIGTTPVGLPGHPLDPTSPTANPTTGQNTVANDATGLPQTSTSALTNSLYRAEHPTYTSVFPYDELHKNNLLRQPSIDNGLPLIEAPYDNASAYGSPRDDEGFRFGLGLSPGTGRGLSVMDAPLPASFDSNGISNAARFPAAPWPSSVPSKFGIDSPSPSLSNAKDSRTSEALKSLHTSAFGSSEHLITPTVGSPSYGSFAEEYFGKRPMHSSRFARPHILSASLPKTSADRDWRSEFVFDDDDSDNLPENYVPENLQDLLTPAEKARRGSIRADDVPTIDGVTKYGSPIGTSPGGRWAPVFKEEELSRSARASAFGHVGSPLRTSTLAQEMSGSLGRPSSTRSGSDQMSMLSQQLQRSRLEDAAGSSSPHLHPATARNPIGNISKDAHRHVMERHVSSGSVSSSVTGRFTTPIDEEDPAFVFSMEDEEEPAATRARKRASNGLAMGGWSSFAAVVAGKGPNANKDQTSLPVNGR